MKKLLLLSFSLFLSVALFAQNSTNSSAGLPNDLIPKQSIREMHDDSNRNIKQGGNYPINPAGTGSLIQRTAFAYQTFPAADQRFVTIPFPENPDELTIIKDTIFSDFVSSGIFAPDGTFYMTDAGSSTGTSTLYTVDVETGETTIIGNMAGDITSQVNAITYDHNTETFYIATSTQLATINIETAHTSLVGSFGIPDGLMIEIAFGEAGNLYGIDLGTNKLYSINKETAVVSEIGHLGFNLNFGAGSSYDRVNGIYYLLGINNNTQWWVNELREVNLDTGITTVVYSWPTSTQFTAFDLMPASGGQITSTPTAVCAGEVEIFFDSGQSPDHEGDIEYQWQLSVQGSSFEDIIGQNSETMTYTGTITQTTRFRRVATLTYDNGRSVSAFSNVTSISVPHALTISNTDGNPLTQQQLRNIPFDIRVNIVDINGDPINDAFPDIGTGTLTLTASGGNEPAGELRFANADEGKPVTVQWPSDASSVEVQKILYTGLSDPDNGPDVTLNAVLTGVCESDLTGTNHIAVRDISFSVEASPESIPANGTSTSTITVTLTDTEDTPGAVTNTLITVTTDLGTFVDTSGVLGGTVTATTDADGKVILTLRSGIEPGIATITALCPGACPATTTVEFFSTNVLNKTQTKGYSTITDAIYAAESGDIIKISSGTYTETYTTDGKDGLGFEFGDSTGCVDVIGNVTYNEGDILTFEISGTVPEPGLGGTNPCLYHDQHNITGKLTLNNPQLNVSFINGLKPATGDSFVIITANELVGQFSTQLIQQDGVNMVLTHDYEKGEVILTTVTPVFRLEINSGR